MKYILALFISLVSGLNLQAAGTSDGGGGVGVRCGTSLELLDLHEIKLAGETISYAPSTKDEAIDLSSSKLGNHYYTPSPISSDSYIDFLKKNIVSKIFNGESFQNPETGKLTNVEFVDSLPLSNDVGRYNLKPGCTLEQVAYYYGNNETLKIVNSQWNELSWLDRSALVSHEIHYFLDRYDRLENFGQAVITSERARKFVGMLYSKTGVVAKYNLLPISNKYICATNADSPAAPTTFSIFSTGSNQFTAVFNKVQSYSSAYQTTAVFNDNIANLTDWFQGKMNSKTSLSIATKDKVPTFEIRITKNQNSNPVLQAFTVKNEIKTPLGSQEELICWNPED